MGLHLVILHMWQIEIFHLSRVGVHYRVEKKCLGKLWFKGQLQADSFLVKLILLSHKSQGDCLIICKLDYMLLF